jgi:hypothetical protein
MPEPGATMLEACGQEWSIVHRRGDLWTRSTVIDRLRKVRASRIFSALECAARPHFRRFSRAGLQNGAGIEDAKRVECAFDLVRESHHVRAELSRQSGFLRPADSMLTSDGAAELDGQLHDLVEG